LFFKKFFGVLKQGFRNVFMPLWEEAFSVHDFGGGEAFAGQQFGMT
jgi:hypothetical protein